MLWKMAIYSQSMDSLWIIYGKYMDNLWLTYLLIMTNIAIEHGHRNSWCTNEKWWFSRVTYLDLLSHVSLPEEYHHGCIKMAVKIGRLKLVWGVLQATHPLQSQIGSAKSMRAILQRQKSISMFESSDQQNQQTTCVNQQS